MGKAIIILVIGMSVIISMLIFNLNKNSGIGLQSTLDSYSETKSRLIANSGIEVYLEKLRRDKALSGNFLNNSLMSGSYDIYIYGPDSLLRIKSIGHFNGATHTSIASAKREKITIPNISSSIYVSSDNLDLNLHGNMDIDGNDHNMDGTLVPGTSVYGFGVDDSVDSAYIVNTIKPKISNSIQGTGGSPSVSVVNNTTNWLEVAEDFIFAADTTLPTGTYSTGTILGTAANPKITYISGDVNFSGTTSGYGILVVNGDLEISGNFTFRGIVIAYGDSKIETKTTGDSGIYGASIFVGQSLEMQATGNAQLYYSSQAIENAKANLKSSRFQILSWWE